MLELEELNKIWDNAVENEEVYQKPKILLALYDEQWFYVLDDSRSIVFLLSVDKVGKRGIGKGVHRAFAAPIKFCKKSEDKTFYNIENDHIVVVGCQKPFSPYRKEQDLLKSFIE